MRNALFILLLLCAGLLRAQSVFDLLYGGDVNEAVDVEITLPLDSLDDRTPNDLHGIMTFADQTGRRQLLGVKVGLRGKFRRTRCSTPPLKLDFSKSQLAGMGLSDHDKYKLVNSCYGDSTATDLLLKEYLAYRAYALVSPTAHFRTQLLRLTLRDATGTQPDRVDYAFLIEDPDEMAARFGGRELEKADGLDAVRFDPTAEATHAAFQYLIGNADWSIPLQRNVKFVERPDGMLVPVAYDFDFSGWVGAPYASPTRETGQQSIYQRVYLGYHQEERVLRQVVQNMRDHRRDILRMIQDFELLNKRDRSTLQRFVGLFYEATSTMTLNTGEFLYDQLRGETADIIPPGAKPQNYRERALR